MRVPGNWTAIPLVCALAAAGTGAADAAGGDAHPALTGSRLYIETETPEYRRFVMDGPLDADYMRRILARLGPRETRGLIVHLGGCPYAPSRMAVHSQARFMASLGYAVLVAPPLPGEASGGNCRAAGAGELHSARIKQLDRLVEAALQLPWGDRRRLFVSGFGEGADAVLDYVHPALRGRVALAPGCGKGSAHRTLPTLILIARHDLRYAAVDGAEAQHHCAAAAADPYVEIFEADGGLHDVLIYTESRVALSHFLVRAAYRPAPPP